MKTRNKAVALGLAMVLASAGCTPLQGPSADEPPPNRARNTALAVGAALLVGALLVSTARSNSKDAIRDLAPNAN